MSEVREVIIKDLTPHTAFAWKVKARIASRSPLRTMGGTDGRVFNVILIDARGSEIRAVVYNDAIDMFSDLLQPGNVCWFERCSLRIAKRGVTTCAHQYELTIGCDAQVLATEDDSTIPRSSYHLSSIEALADTEPNTMIDLIGAVVEANAIEEVRSKDGTSVYCRREVKLADDSNLEISCTLWGDFALMAWGALVGHVIAFRDCRVTSFHGVSLTSTASSSLIEDPSEPEADRIRTWLSTRDPERSININLHRCAFSSLGQIANLTSNAMVNVVGIVREVGAIVLLPSPSGKQTSKRSIKISDEHGASIFCTLWNQDARKASSQWVSKVMVVTKGRVRDYNGRSVSTIPTSTVVLDPPLPAVVNLKRWLAATEASQSDSFETPSEETDNDDSLMQGAFDE